MAISFSITDRSRSTAARTGRVQTPHGSFDTPAFMPVGTRGTLRGLTPRQVADTGSQIVLNNAYHLMLRPGDDSIARRGGVQQFMRWDGPILTDSGGYQAFSMADINAIDDDGVTFKSIINGSKVRLTPERSMQVQNNLGADIIMAFDDCPPATADHVDARRLQQANERTVRWLERCVAAHQRSDEQALFGIVQGGTDLDMRRKSVEDICNIDLPGYAIGGVAVGEGSQLIRQVTAFTAPLLPDEKPRYLMGVGYEQDILAAVQAGVDMFDCVLPTRNGRNANVFTRSGRLHLRNSCHTEDDGVIERGCDCEACAGGFSRAYLRHLFLSKEMLGPILASLHNIRHFQRLLLDIRRAIRDDARPESAGGQAWSCLHRAWPVLGVAVDRQAAPGGVDDQSLQQSQHRMHQS